MISFPIDPSGLAELVLETLEVLDDLMLPLEVSEPRAFGGIVIFTPEPEEPESSKLPPVEGVIG